MIRFVDYRKNLLKSSAHRSNVLEGVDRYFEILRLDLIEATKFPRNLSEEFLGDASVMMDQLSTLTNEVHKYIINEDINTFKKVFHRYIIETAAAASPPNLKARLDTGPGTLTGDAANQFRDKLAWAIKQFIDEVKAEVSKQMAGLSATATTAATTTAASPDPAAAGRTMPPAPPVRSSPPPVPTSTIDDEDEEEEPAPSSHRPGVSSPYHHRTGIHQPYPSMPATGGRWKKSTSDPNNNWFGGIGNMFKSVGQWFKDKLHRGWHGANLADSVRAKFINLVETSTNDILDALMKTIDGFGKDLTDYITKHATEYVDAIKAGSATAASSTTATPVPGASQPPIDDPSVITGRQPGAAVDAGKTLPNSTTSQAPIPSDQRTGAPEGAVKAYKDQKTIDAINARILKGEPISELELQRLSATFDKSWDIGTEPVLGPDGKQVIKTSKDGKQTPQKKSKEGRWLKILNHYLAHLRSKGVAGVPADASEYKRAVPTPKALTAAAITELRDLVLGKEKPIGVALLDQKEKDKGGKKRVSAARRHYGGCKDNSELYDRIVATKDIKAEDLSANGYKAPDATTATTTTTTQTPAGAPANTSVGDKPKSAEEIEKEKLQQAKAALLGDKGKEGGEPSPSPTLSAEDQKKQQALLAQQKAQEEAARIQAERDARKNGTQTPTQTSTQTPAGDKPVASQPAAPAGNKPAGDKPVASQPAVKPEGEKPAATPPAATDQEPDEANLDLADLCVVLNPGNPYDEGDNKQGETGQAKMFAMLGKIDEDLAKIEAAMPGFREALPDMEDEQKTIEIFRSVYPALKAKCGGKIDGRNQVHADDLKKAMLDEYLRSGKVAYAKKKSVDPATLDAQIAAALGGTPSGGGEVPKKADGVIEKGVDTSGQTTPDPEEVDKKLQQDKTVNKAYAAIADEDKAKTPEDVLKARIREIVVASWDREDFQKMKSSQLYALLAHMASKGYKVSEVAGQLGSLPEIYEALESINMAALKPAGKPGGMRDRLQQKQASEDPMKRVESFLAKKKIRALKDEFPDGWAATSYGSNEDLMISREANKMLGYMRDRGASFEQAIAPLRQDLEKAQKSREANEPLQQDFDTGDAPPPADDEVVEPTKGGMDDEDSLAAKKVASAAMAETAEEKEIKASLTDKKFDNGVTYLEFLTRKKYEGNVDRMADRISALLAANGNQILPVLTALIQEAMELSSQLGDAAFDWLPKQKKVEKRSEDDVRSQLLSKKFDHGMTAGPGEELSHPNVSYYEFLKAKKFEGNAGKMNTYMMDLLTKNGDDVNAVVAQMASEAEALRQQLGDAAFSDIVTITKPEPPAPIEPVEPEEEGEDIVNPDEDQDDEDDEEDIVEPDEEEEDEDEVDIPDDSVEDAPAEQCPQCSGNGKCPACLCETCKGAGKVGADKCPDCHGIGSKLDNEDCGLCSGSGECGGCGGTGTASNVDIDALADRDDDDDYGDLDDEEEEKARHYGY